MKIRVEYFLMFLGLGIYIFQIICGISVELVIKNSDFEYMSLMEAFFDVISNLYMRITWFFMISMYLLAGFIALKNNYKITKKQKNEE